MSDSQHLNEKDNSSNNDEMSQNKSEVYNCEFCEKSIDEYQKEHHYGICDKFESFITDHICQLCDKIFENNKQLTNHIQSIHKKPKQILDSTKNTLQISKNPSSTFCPILRP